MGELSITVGLNKGKIGEDVLFSSVSVVKLKITQEKMKNGLQENNSCTITKENKSWHM